MKFFKLSGSLLSATALLAAIAPAYAGPFDVKPAGVFGSPVLTGPVVTPGAVSTPADAAAKPTGGSGSEVDALGTHQSWVDPKNLAKDPRALCSDVGLGSNTKTSSTYLALSSSSKSASNSASSSNKGGGGGFSILGIGANGSGSSQGSNNQSQSKAEQSTRSQSSSDSSSTVQVGRNCDAFVQSAAARDMNYEDNLTKRYEIKTGRRGQQVDNLLDGKK